MKRPSRARATLIAALAVLASLAFAGSASAAPTLRFFDVTAPDGVVLKANAYEPDSSYAGPRPAVVLISSWSLNDLEYLAQAKWFAEQGYVAVSYTTRGFWLSGGKIETAGPKDIADLRSVIDWTLANTRSDATKIGAAGISYGSGISLLGAGADSRIRAVAAMSTWTDLVASLFGNQTRHLQAAGLLDLAGTLTGRPSAELNTVLDDFYANRNIPGLTAFAQPRSAKSVVSQINANGPAIMMANAYGDSLFEPNQLRDFYGQLTVPKRIELRPGDHAIPELSGILGIQNDVWTNVRRWFDRHLRGIDNGIQNENPVLLQLRGGSGTYESYPTWSAQSSSSLKLGLSDIHWWSGEGDLISGTQSGWSDGVPGGIGTIADGGVAMLTNGWEALTGDPPYVWMPSVSRIDGDIWQSSYFSSAKRIRGAVKLRLTMKSSKSGQSTIVAYLYDVDALGNADLITHVPFTARGIAANQSIAVDTEFPSTTWDVPAGHRVTLVVDTEDPLYADSQPAFSTVTLSSPSGAPSAITLPLR